MLDTRACLERHNFLTKYKTYMEDTRNDKFEYVNQWTQTLFIEGRKYIGFVQSLSFQKASHQPFLYQYSITFVSLDDFQTYHTQADYKAASEALLLSNGSKSNNSDAVNKLIFENTSRITNGLYSLLNK